MSSQGPPILAWRGAVPIGSTALGAFWRTMVKVVSRPVFNLSGLLHDIREQNHGVQGARTRRAARADDYQPQRPSLADAVCRGAGDGSAPADWRLLRSHGLRTRGDPGRP